MRASITYENENEEQEEVLEEQLHDFYNYKSELYDESVSNEKVEAIEENFKVESEVEIVKKSSGRARKVKLPPPAASQIHICEICANQYKYRHALETHMRRHRGEKPFSCEYCNRFVN